MAMGFKLGHWFFGVHRLGCDVVEGQPGSASQQVLDQDQEPSGAPQGGGNVFDNDFQELAFAQEGEDILLDRFLNGQKRGFYVDIGCHHPSRFSNTKRFYLRGWQGINVDANREAMDLFSAQRERDVNIWSAVGNEDTVADYFVMNGSALNTLDPDRVRYLKENTPYFLVETLKIPVRTLSSILDEYATDVEEIDLLSIDVEGWDLKVLKSNDWARYRPIFLLVEDHVGARDPEFQSEMRGFLQSEGYGLRCVFFNSMLYQRDD